MKILISVFLLMGILVAKSYGDVYILYDKKTKEIKSAIESDSAVIQEGWEKRVLPGKLKDYGLTKHPTYYKLTDGNFIENNAKVSAEANAKEEGQAQVTEMQIIQRKAMQTACEALEADGVKFKTLKCSDFEQ